jgi:hypothetical protein
LIAEQKLQWLELETPGETLLPHVSNLQFTRRSPDDTPRGKPGCLIPQAFVVMDIKDSAILSGLLVKYPSKDILHNLKALLLYEKLHLPRVIKVANESMNSTCTDFIQKILS